MEQLDDSALLRRYVEDQSDDAFAAVVMRHINLVYSVALRQTGSPENAEEITQAVFVILARKAHQVRHDKALSSWLFQATRLTAKNFLRSEMRRQNREQEAYMQSVLNQPEDDLWRKMAPLVDDAVASLREKDRQAVLLRFYEEKSLRDVGQALGTNEGAAEKRVSRALEKLRSFFAKRGVNSTTAIISDKISAHSVQAAPAALAKAVTALAVAKGAASSASTLTLIKGAMKIMAWTKAKTAIVAAAVVVLAAGTTGVAVKEIASSRQEAAYEYLFEHPDGHVTSKLEQTAPTLIVRPTRYPNRSQGIWTGSGKGLFVNATMDLLLGWAYTGVAPARQVLPDDLPKGGYDYLNTLPNGNDALRERLKSKFGLVAHREMRPADVLALVVRDPARLDSFRTKGGHFFCSTTARGNTDVNCFTNASLSLLAEQIVEAYFNKPCVDQTDTKAKYDFAIQWEIPRGLTREAALEALRPVFKEQINELGLDLVPTNVPMEMLVVEKVK